MQRRIGRSRWPILNVDSKESFGEEREILLQPGSCFEIVAEADGDLGRYVHGPAVDKFSGLKEMIIEWIPGL